MKYVMRLANRQSPTISLHGMVSMHWIPASTALVPDQPLTVTLLDSASDGHYNVTMNIRRWL